MSEYDIMSLITLYSTLIKISKKKHIYWAIVENRKKEPMGWGDGSAGKALVMQTWDPNLGSQPTTWYGSMQLSSLWDAETRGPNPGASLTVGIALGELQVQWEICLSKWSEELQKTDTRWWLHKHTYMQIDPYPIRRKEDKGKGGKEKGKEKRSGAHFNLSTGEAEASRHLFEFKARLVYTSSSRPARATWWDPVSKR